MYLIRISISQQTLQLFEAPLLTDLAKPLSLTPVKTYKVSTGLNGVGGEKNSGKTPLGKHIIRAKIGKDQPLNSVFVGRRATGEIYSQALAKMHPNRDWILTRILWLSGTELGVNRLGQMDTMQRYIYIHGTPDSESMGVALSHGCVRMHNKDLVELFDLVDVYTPVEIVC